MKNKLYMWEMENVNKSWASNPFVKFCDYKSFRGVYTITLSAQPNTKFPMFRDEWV